MPPDRQISKLEACAVHKPILELCWNTKRTAGATNFVNIGLFWMTAIPRCRNFPPPVKAFFRIEFIFAKIN